MDPSYVHARKMKNTPLAYGSKYSWLKTFIVDNGKAESKNKKKEEL